MRHLLTLALIATLSACSTTQQTIGNRTARLATDAKEGDRPAELVKSGVFEYPKFARAHGIEGRTSVEVLVKADGTVGGIRILKRELNMFRVWGATKEDKWDDVTNIFDEVVVDMMKNSTWKAGIKNGAPSDTRVEIPLAFSLTKK